MATKLEKTIWLLDLLRRSGGVTLEEVVRAWDRSSVNDEGTELSVRSFRRYCREIEDRFGLRVRCDRHDFTYRVEEDPAGEQGLQHWLLDTMSVDQLLRESQGLRERILVENIPSGQRYLGQIIGAMRDGIVLEMSYARFTGEEGYTTWLQPYFVKVFGQRWYVVGPTGRHPGEPHVYALDRVTALRETPGRFVFPAGFDPAAFFADSYGIFRGEGPAERIILRAGEREAKYLRSLPLHPSQRELSDAEAARLGFGTESTRGAEARAARLGVEAESTLAGKANIKASVKASVDSVMADSDRPSYYFLLRLAPTLDFIQYLLSQGADLEVFAPASLRAELARRAAAISELYK